MPVTGAEWLVPAEEGTMADETTGGDRTLATLAREWGAYQDQLVRAVEPLTDEQLRLTAAPHLRSIGALVTHIAGTRAGWMTTGLRIGQGQLDSIATWNVPEPPALSATELVDALNQTWEVLRRHLDMWTTAELDEEVTATRGGKSYTFARRWIVWHLLEHDLHHGGELAFSLGMHGLAAPRI
jgi:uncharacterized damage-inducible protein DinB